MQTWGAPECGGCSDAELLSFAYFFLLGGMDVQLGQTEMVRHYWTACLSLELVLSPVYTIWPTGFPHFFVGWHLFLIAFFCPVHFLALCTPCMYYLVESLQIAPPDTGPATPPFGPVKMSGCASAHKPLSPCANWIAIRWHAPMYVLCCTWIFFVSV
jgi:hypothetical protein